MRIFSIALFFVHLCFLPALGQERFIPHITDLNGDFQTWIILENISTEFDTFQLSVYTKEGYPRPPVLGSLQPGEIQIYEQLDLLGNEPDVGSSHFLIGSENHPATNIKFSVAYGLKSGEGSPAYAPEMNDVAPLWRLFAGNWPEVYDAIAVVNFGEEAATIKVVHRALDRTMIKEFVMAENALPLSKTLYVIGGMNSIFDRTKSPIFEIESNQNIGVSALQGDLPDSQYLWVNLATPQEPR